MTVVVGGSGEPLVRVCGVEGQAGWFDCDDEGRPVVCSGEVVDVGVPEVVDNHDDGGVPSVDEGLQDACVFVVLGRRHLVTVCPVRCFTGRRWGHLERMSQKAKYGSWRTLEMKAMS